MTIEQLPGFHPVSLIHVSDLNDSIIFLNITTQNGSVEHLLNIGIVELSRKGIPYMNVTRSRYGGKRVKEYTTYHQNKPTSIAPVTLLPLHTITLRLRLEGLPLRGVCGHPLQRTNHQSPSRFHKNVRRLRRRLCLPAGGCYGKQRKKLECPECKELMPAMLLNDLNKCDNCGCTAHLFDRD